MAVARVVVGSDVFQACLTHALSTEREEIMGLLVGEWIDTAEGREAHVYDLYIMPRSDKRKDRVEIPPEELVNASSAAETVARQLGRPTSVLGWYHSHPKITVEPSHVDVGTQADYQGLDAGFIGLIFAVFYQDKDKLNKVEVTAFQSQYNRRTNPHLLIAPPGARTYHGPLRILYDLPRILFQEEQDAYTTSLHAAQQLASSELQQQTIAMHHSAVYSKALVGLIDKICGPLLQELERRQRLVEAEVRELTERKEDLLKRKELLL